MRRVPVGRGRRHLTRYREIAAVLAEEGLGAIPARLGLLAPARARKQVHDETTPARVRHALERIGPAGVKVGQLLSTRSDLVPEAYRLELRRLQDDVTPIAYEVVARVIMEELGDAPDVLFEYFEREPMASASIGQVHAARLQGGPDVAVKVQRPGISDRVEIDLEILRTQARRAAEIGLVPRTLDAGSIADEFADAVERELDYLAEAANTERFAVGFAGDPEIEVPRVYHDYTTRRVLTMDRIEGIPFNRLDLIEQVGLDRSVLAHRGVRAYLDQIFRIGAFHADPHPGNLFALPNERIGFTDFGRVGHVSPAIADSVGDLLLAIVDRDADLATDALLEVSMQRGAIDVVRLRQELSAILGKYAGVTLGERNLGEMLEDLLEVVRGHDLDLPGDFLLLTATLAVLEGVGRELDPSFDFLEVARPYSRGVMAEQLEPSRLWMTLTSTVRRLARRASALPASLDRALERLAGGEFRVAVRPEGYESFVQRAEELVDRLAFSVLISAFVVGFATLLSQEWLPAWVHVISALGMFGAVGVSVWLFTSIYLARWRGSRR